MISQNNSGFARFKYVILVSEEVLALGQVEGRALLNFQVQNLYLLRLPILLLERLSWGCQNLEWLILGMITHAFITKWRFEYLSIEVMESVLVSNSLFVLVYL